jgi:predicted phosphodiesterase
MGKNDFWSIVSIAAFLGIGVAGYYVIDKFGKGSSGGLPDIQGIIDGILGSISPTTTPPADGDGNGGTTTPPATIPPDTTTPPATTPGTLVFAAAGDWGSGRNGNWQKVVAQMATQKPSVVLVPGDMSYSGGVGKWKPVTDAIKKIPAKVFGAQGNHDDSSYGSTFDAYSNSVTTVGNVSFMSLNANSGASAVTYARANFSKMTAKWKVVFFHQPAVSTSSSHGQDKTMAGLIPDFEKAGVQIVIGAHNHIYLRYVKTNGVTYFVSGLGGESPYPIGSNCGGCPAIAKSFNSTFGFVIFSASPTSCTGQFIDFNGKVIDTFTI